MYAGNHRDRRPRAAPQPAPRALSNAASHAGARPSLTGRHEIMHEQLHLNAFLMGVGHHEAAWRHPRPRRPRRSTSPLPGLGRSPSAASSTRCSSPTACAVGPASSTTRRRARAHHAAVRDRRVTEHIGLIATASTTYNEPYTLARKFASLDHISERPGRVEHRHLRPAPTRRELRPRPVPAHEDRYARADEFLEVALALWDSWEDDAIARRQAASGTFADPTRVHTDRPRRPPLPGARPAQYPALSAGPPAAGPGRIVGGRQGLRRPLRRGGVHRPADPRRRPGSSTPT